VAPHIDIFGVWLIFVRYLVECQAETLVQGKKVGIIYLTNQRKFLILLSMNSKSKKPKTLQDAIIYFADADNCLNYMAAKRWPNGVYCPGCGRSDVSFLARQKKWQCKSAHDHRQFSVKVGTIFEDSPLGLDKWLPAVWMLTNCKNGISSYELARALGVTQKTAWFMLHRIRLALQEGSLLKVGGNGTPIEVDETFVGGKAKNQHKSRRIELQKIRSAMPDWKATDRYPGKTAVMGILDRDARKVRATVVPNVKRDTLQAQILTHIEHGSCVMTDQATAYEGINSKYIHEVINHLQGYVRGHIHTNGIENFWSLLKRGLHGTYVCVEPFHLSRYVDEQVFRFNNRKDGDRKISDSERFDLALSQVSGKRLTFAEVTGKVAETSN
jgi:transposase-like protein